MNIHEYQAKQILAKYNVPVSSGIVAFSKEELEQKMEKFSADLYVVKAQIHAGGRGKAGGVKVLKDKEEAKKAAQIMLGQKLVTHQTGEKGQLVRRVYIEAGCDIEKEYYLSLVIDRATSRITFMASTEGGVDIEEVAEHTPEKIVKISVDAATGIQAFHGRALAFNLGFSGQQAKDIANIATNLYKAFVESDASQIEINPLVVKSDGELLALDAKINFDENALFRQAEIATLRDESEEDPLEARAAKSDLNYIRMEGNIGCMVNGAGLAMSTMDIIKLYGARPANFLDVGGGATQEKVAEALKIILSDDSVQGILINIFGGIMRCDIIARGIVAAAKEAKINIPLVVRLAGTNFALGKEILSKAELKIIAADDLADAAAKIVKAVNN